ncbi:MAG: alpha/beta fold hydrolase [Acidimicrobiales bacterium]
MRFPPAALMVISLVLGACAGSWVDDGARRHAAEQGPGVPASPPASGGPPSTAAADVPTVSFVEGDCPMPVEPGDSPRLRCGTLDVPVDRADLTGPRAAVAVAIVESAAPTPSADPIVYLHGGPGGLALSDYIEWVFPEHPLLSNRDLILVDQRGSGWSTPSLNCPAAEDSNNPVSELVDCAEALADDGIELEHFTTHDIAADIVDLRGALGIDQWNLYGVSYGTRVALTMMELDPEGVRAAVLDSPYPPVVDAYQEQAANGRAAIDAVLSSCADDPRCGGAFGDLRQPLDQLLADLAEDPVPTVLEGSTDVPKLLVDDAVFASALFGSLYDRFNIPDVPLATQSAIDGDLGLALELLGVGEGFRPRQEPDDDYESLFDAELAFWAPECAEEVELADRDAVTAATDADDPIEVALLDEVESAFAVCDRLDVSPADPAGQGAVVADAPTLILVGQFDPITPPVWAAVAAESLTEAAVIEVVGSGHAPSFEQCPRDAMVAFFDDNSLPPTVECLADQQALPFSIE